MKWGRWFLRKILIPRNYIIHCSSHGAGHCVLCAAQCSVAKGRTMDLIIIRKGPNTLLKY